MKSFKKLLFLVVSFICALSSSAQMEFSFTGLSGVTNKHLNDGTTLVQLPAGTDLTAFSSLGMSATVDGTSATLTDIVPNPSTASITDGALNVFYYKGKSYSVRFTDGEYFTAVFFTDAALGDFSGVSSDAFATYSSNIINMGKSGGQHFSFDALPGYTPTADIAFYLGDMTTNSEVPVIKTLPVTNVAKVAAVTLGQFTTLGNNSTINSYGICISTSSNPSLTSCLEYKAAPDYATDDGYAGQFGVWFDNLSASTTYHIRAYCTYTHSGTTTTIYGEDVSFSTTTGGSVDWAFWSDSYDRAEEYEEGAGDRIQVAMDSAKTIYNNYTNLTKWYNVNFNTGTATADCNTEGWMNYGPVARYQWVGTAQHEMSHGLGVGLAPNWSSFASPWPGECATQTLRVFLRDQTMYIYHDSQHIWPGGINQMEEVTTGTSNNKGTYTCSNAEMLRANAMIVNALSVDGMQCPSAKFRNDFSKTWANSSVADESDEDVEANLLTVDNNASSGLKRNLRTENNTFQTAVSGFHSAGIPLILTPGELDIARDYYDDGTSGLNATGYALNQATYSVVTAALEDAQEDGIENLQRFTNGSSTTTYIQAQPFTFTFKGVRFYNGQKFWFDKPMRKSGSSYYYYRPDNIFSNLSSFVSSHTDETSIWMQHIPFAETDYMWMDANSSGKSGTITGTASSYTTASSRRTALANLINTTAHAAHFSGHSGTYAENTDNTFTDYTVDAISSTPGDVVIALCKVGMGVVEVKRVNFRDFGTIAVQKDDDAYDIPTQDSGHDNAVLGGLVEAMESLNTGNSTIETAVTAAKSVNSESGVTSSIESINTAFVTYANNIGELDVTAMLGDNLDFETTIGSVNANMANVYEVPGWNDTINTNQTAWAFLSYKTDLSSPVGSGNALYIRENWKGSPNYPSLIQVYKDAVLPAGSYNLKFYLRQPYQNYTETLNYYEINGERTEFSAGTSWETKELSIIVDEPSVFRLSFGFYGSTSAGNYSCEVDVDDITLTYNGTSEYKEALAEAKAAAAANEEDDGPATAAVAQYEWSDEELATKAPSLVTKATAVLRNATTISNATGYSCNSLITNVDFTEGYTGSNTAGSKVQTPNGWTFDNTLSGWRDTYVDATNKLFNMYAGTVTLSNLYQLLENMPNGNYTLSADICTEADGGYLYGTGVTQTSVALGTTSATGAFTFDAFSVTFEVSNNELTIGVNTTANFYQIKNITLVYQGNSEEDAYHRALRLCRKAMNDNESSVAGAATAAVLQYAWDDDEYAEKSTSEISTAISVLTNGTTISNAGQVATSLVSNVDFTGGYTSGTASSGRVQIPADWTFIYTLSGWNDCFVDASNKFFNAWAGTITRAELYQTVSNLPNGVYRMTADVLTDINDGTSTIALYINSDNSYVARSEEVTGTTNVYSNYSCASDVANNTAIIGIRSDRAYYKIANIALTYVGATAEAETDASYLRQDYFWNGRNALEFDASADKYANATGTVIYPNQPNQLITAASATQFANTNNKIVSGTCANLVITDGSPMQVSNAFTATTATYNRSMSNVWGTVILPFAVNSTDEYKFYELIGVNTESEDNGVMIFSSVDQLAAGTPGVFIADGSFDVSENNAAVTTTASTQADYITGWQMQGAYESTVIDATAAEYYYISGDNFYHATGTLTLNPFRACFLSAASSASAKYRITVDGEATDISASGASDKALMLLADNGCLHLISNSDTDYQVVALNGVIVASGSMLAGEKKTLNLAKGIYIVNGIKIVIN